MRILLSMPIAAMMLAGCAGMDLFAPEQNFSAPGPCGQLAQQRLADARIYGYADGYEKAIFDHAHRACLAQNAAQSPAP